MTVLLAGFMAAVLTAAFVLTALAARAAATGR